MGRHGTAPGPDAPAVPPGRFARLPAWLATAVERVALAAGAAVPATLVLAWAGVRWRPAVIAGAVAGLLVLVAASVATTVPTPHQSTARAPRTGP